MTERVQILIAKFCSDELTTSEAQELAQWASKDKNKKAFSKYIALNYAVEEINA